MLVIDEPAAAVWMAQMNTIVFHPWPTLAGDIDHPDQLRLDLDPQPGTRLPGCDSRRSRAAFRPAGGGPDGVREDVGQPRSARVRADRAAARLHRGAARRDLGRARARAPHAGRGDHRVVEGGARRAGLRRLQPGGARPHDRRRLQRARAAGCDGVDPLDWDEVAPGLDPTRSPCARCPGAPRPVEGLRREARHHRRAAAVVGARRRERSGRAAVSARAPEDAGRADARAAEPREEAREPTSSEPR